MKQLVEEARKSMIEALTFLEKLNEKTGISNSTSILWKATESLDYASLLTSLAHDYSNFIPDIEVNVDDNLQSELKTIKDDIKKSLECLENDPQKSYVLLKRTISSLRALRKVS